MSYQKNSGEVNLDHPVIDEQQDGIRLYFHPLPPLLLKCPYILPKEEDDPKGLNNKKYKP